MSKSRASGRDKGAKGERRRARCDERTGGEEKRRRSRGAERSSMTTKKSELAEEAD